MNKYFFLLVFLVVNVGVITNAQTCTNPNTYLEQLKSKALTKDSLHAIVQDDAEFIQLSAHDTIADIGSFNGYWPSLYSIFSDSIIFYLNDITNVGFKYFDSTQAACARFTEVKTSNKFKIIIGNDSSTGLPDHIFNKVILKDALHHFKLQDKMLTDIKRVTKSDGRLFLYEPIKGKELNNGQLCHGAMTKEELLKVMYKNGFELAINKDGTERVWEFWRTNGIYCWLEFKLTKN